MSIATQIKTLYGEKETIIKEMEILAPKDLDEDEKEVFKTLQSESESLDARIERLEATEKTLAKSKAVKITAPAIVIPAIEKDSEYSKLFMARKAHALFMGGGSKHGAAEYAKSTLNDPLLARALVTPNEVIQKAAVSPGDSTTAGYAAELVQINQMNEAFIEMLRPVSVLMSFPGRQLSFGGAGSITIPRQATGTTGGWVAEGSAIKVDAASFENITLTPKKVGNIVIATAELLRRSTPSALSILQTDLINGVAQVIDKVFVSNDAATATSPAGVQTFGTITASAGDTLDNITTDLKGCISRLQAVNMPMTSPVWLINPVRATALRFIRDGLGAYAFKDEMNGGTLVGYPFIESNTVDDEEVMLIDANQILIASEPSPDISLSDDATVHMESSPTDDIGGAATPVRSLWQTNSVGIRTISIIDFNSRYAEACQALSGVTW